MKSNPCFSTLFFVAFSMATLLTSTLARNASPCLTDSAKCGVQTTCLSKCENQCSYNAEAVCRECLMGCGAPSYEANCFIALRYQQDRYTCNAVLTQCEYGTPTQIAKGGVCEVSTLGIIVICLICAAVAAISLFVVLCYPVFLSCCLYQEESETKPIYVTTGHGDYRSITFVSSSDDEEQYSDGAPYSTESGSMDPLDPRPDSE